MPKNEIIIGIIGYTQGMTQLKIAPPTASKKIPKSELALPIGPPSFGDEVATAKDDLSARGEPGSISTTTVSVFVIGG